MQSFTQTDRQTIEDGPIDLQVEVVDGKFLADTASCVLCGSVMGSSQGTTLQQLLAIIW